MASRQDESIRLWSVRSGACAAVFAGDQGHISEVLFVDMHRVRAMPTAAPHVHAGYSGVWIVHCAIPRSSYMTPDPIHATSHACLHAISLNFTWCHPRAARMHRRPIFCPLLIYTPPCPMPALCPPSAAVRLSGWGEASLCRHGQHSANLVSASTCLVSSPHAFMLSFHHRGVQHSHRVLQQ